MRYRILIISAIMASLASTAEARTWYVAADGSGDAPTLLAAMDSANANDIVLAGPGNHYVHRTLVIPSRVTVTSEAGPHETRIIGSGPLPPINGVHAGDRSKFDGFWVEGFTTTTVSARSGATITNNIIMVVLGAGLLAQFSCTIENNLFVSGDVFLGPPGIIFTHNIVLSNLYCDFDPQILPICNNLLGLICQVYLDQNPYLNFSLDPEFCGVPGSGNYFLQSGSPARPATIRLGEGAG
ncbi:MAG: hypothetical protein IH969_04370 [Candidatus Krumholzibacteriota bacterium]|nr:hypothetical protein [Candidatus Krumholzibacteriota bacterium]